MENTRHIFEHLRKIQRDNEIKILYACESGSRAWGMDSSDSDYDIRFFYQHPLPWYLNLDKEQKQDTITVKVDEYDLDFHGWDIRKAARLFRKSNASPYEWLQSPYVYHEDNFFVPKLRMLVPKFASDKALFHHYISEAKSIYKKYLANDDTEVDAKKYLYVARCLLSSAVVAKGDVIPPPIRFDALLVCVDGKLREELEDLLDKKRNGKELTNTPRYEHIEHWINVSFKESEHIAQQLSGFEFGPDVDKCKRALDDLVATTIIRDFVTERNIPDSLNKYAGLL